MSVLTNPIGVYVDSKRAVKLVDANDRRRILNLYAGKSDITYGGNKDITPNDDGFNLVKPNFNSVEIKSGAEIWVIRKEGDAGNCGYSEEFI